MIDKTAVIEDGAIIGKDVEIGPFCIVGKDVVLGDRVRLVSHVVIDGKTEIDDDTIIYPFAVVGIKSQDLKFQNDEDMTGTKIGKWCRIREYVTIHSGTPASVRGTVIGNNCQIMVNAHIAHDCILGNNIVVSNLAQIAGHVEIGDYAIISGMSAVHQFCHVGEYAFLGAMSGTGADIPPYVIYEGLPARYRTINKVGLTRHGFTPEDIHAIHTVYATVFGGEAGEDIATKILKISSEIKENPYAMKALEFVEHRGSAARAMGSNTNRGLVTGEKKGFRADN